MRWRLFLLGWLGPALFVNPAGNMSSDAVLATAAAVVERGTLEISPRAGALLSRVEGRFYNGTAPGAWVLAVPVYAALRPALVALPPSWLPSRVGPGFAFAPPLELPPERFWLRLLMVWLVMAPLAGLFAVLAGEYARSVPGSSPALLTAGAVGTLLLCHGATYSRQALAALLTACVLLLHLTGRGGGRGAAAALGAVLGCSVAVDYAAAPAIAAIGLFLLLSMPGVSRAPYVAGGAVALALLGAFHWRMFGGPLLTPYHFRVWPPGAGASYRGEFIDFARAQADAGSGLGVGLPGWRALFSLTLARHKGLLVFCPILAAGLYGHARSLREPDRRVFAACMLASFGGQLAFVAGLHGELYQGGFPLFYGPRYLLAAVAPAALGLAALKDRSLAARTAVLLLPVSAGATLLGAMYQDLLLIAGPDWSAPLRMDPLCGFLVRLLSMGPRVPLLDAYGAPAWTQAVTVAVFLAYAAATARREFMTPRR